MTPSQAIAKIEAQIKAIDDASMYVKLFNELKRRKSQRIFVDKKNANGGSHGEYSPNPLYVSNSQAYTPRKFVAKGKEGKTKFKNGNKHKSGYFENYAKYKETIGQGKEVNFILFRNFETSFNTGDSTEVVNGVVKSKLSIKVSAKNPEGKIDFLLDTYPDSWKSSKEEKAFVTAELLYLGKKIL